MIIVIITEAKGATNLWDFTIQNDRKKRSADQI